MQEVQYRVYYLAKKLKIDPNVIFYTWTVPESIVAYAYYVNNDAKEAYEAWRQQKPPRGKPPKKQFVYYKTVKKEELDG